MPDGTARSEEHIACFSHLFAWSGAGSPGAGPDWFWGFWFCTWLPPQARQGDVVVVVFAALPLLSMQ